MSTVPITGSPADQTAMPNAFPAPDTLGVTQRITLLCHTPGATIHYTTDGSTPDRLSPTFDAYQLPVLEAINDGDQGVSTTYTVKAFASSDDLAPSDLATFTDGIARRDKDAYLTTEVSPLLGCYEVNADTGHGRQPLAQVRDTALSRALNRKQAARSPGHVASALRLTSCTTQLLPSGSLNERNEP